MKVLVDENIPRMTVAALRYGGHDVIDVRGTADEGIDDQRLWAIAQQEGRLLITTDKGFAAYRQEPHRGILIIRLRQPNRQRIHDRVMQAVAELQAREWRGVLVVVRDRSRSVFHSKEKP
jgi:predicted nuclease of predicted toxin-antitoxin system